MHYPIAHMGYVYLIKMSDTEHHCDCGKGIIFYFYSESKIQVLLRFYIKSVNLPSKHSNDKYSRCVSTFSSNVIKFARPCHGS